MQEVQKDKSSIVETMGRLIQAKLGRPQTSVP